MELIVSRRALLRRFPLSSRSATKTIAPGSLAGSLLRITITRRFPSADTVGCSHSVSLNDPRMTQRRLPRALPAKPTSRRLAHSLRGVCIATGRRPTTFRRYLQGGLTVTPSTAYASTRRRTMNYVDGFTITEYLRSAKNYLVNESLESLTSAD
jgi:hypothetical protein